MGNIWLAFITGLTTGGISCLAVQGGLLAATMTTDEEKNLARSKKLQKVGVFLAAKVAVHTLLGAALGFLGASLVLSPNLLGWMQIAAGIFMIGTAGRLLNLHPIFRYFQIQPPKFAYRLLRKVSKDSTKSNSLFAPAMMGVLTILIPCGVTQAMMALAIATANPFFAAGIMFAFTLGTSPVFFAVGYAAVALLKKKWFAYPAAIAIFVLALVSINSGQVLRGSVHTLNNYWAALTDTLPTAGAVAGVNAQGMQEVNIEVKSNGYTANTTTLKAGVPVRLTLTTNGAGGCARAFTIPSYNISKVLPATGTEMIEFTPTKAGLLTYSCSMGMYTGQFTVVN